MRVLGTAKCVARCLVADGTDPYFLQIFVHNNSAERAYAPFMGE
jgi:hypothetical protein